MAVAKRANSGFLNAVSCKRSREGAALNRIFVRMVGIIERERTTKPIDRMVQGYPSLVINLWNITGYTMPPIERKFFDFFKDGIEHTNSATS